ncbi:glycoside hydrolase domain-containing protein [Blastococcus montanus]|uniref:glycoside hydrolase domain-containing protein n=1 Tax=Blastococcus montanus TaxID=3144973 RepID=UPI00320916E5
MVSEAQRWVNRTYAGRAGYQGCEEDGRTGWPVMYSLTRALQLELGITTTSNTFGPTTLSKLQAKGDIGPGEPNTNIVAIIQAALYCKGYSPGAISGSFGPGTTGVVGRVMSDMGLGSFSNGTVQPKVFKSLLTMDAYVVVSSGTPAVREIQQWLNSRYWKRTNFFISPCDGLYTRDVQKALMMGIQYELGIADASVNGNFGPATQSGLRSRELTLNSTGIFVQLLSAACVFNGAFSLPDSPSDTYVTTFRSTFDAKLSEWIRAFQQFSYLPVTGIGDYTTWAQLLVSMGDVNRRVYGCDTAETITASRAAALVKANGPDRPGYMVVGRYLKNVPGGRLDKEIKPGELEVIFAAGMRVRPIMQVAGNAKTDFTRLAGQGQGFDAHDRAVGYGFNPGTTIYFAVDYDATDADIDSYVLEYFRGVQQAFQYSGRRYVVGVYGSRNVCRRVSAAGLASKSFVSSMSYGFSGNLGFPLPANWAFNQIQEIAFTTGTESFPLDRDAHRPEIDPGVGPENVGSEAREVEEYMAYVDALYQCAVDYGDGDPSIRVLQYLRGRKYGTEPGWPELLPTAPSAWLTYVAAHAPRHDPQFVEPGSNVALDIDHWAAAASTIVQYGHGSPAPDRYSSNRGDFGGWMGDLCSFYGDWRANEESYASGYLFCQDRLGTVTGLSSFSMKDLLEDVDGFHIGLAVRAGQPINQAFRTYYAAQGCYTTRFSSFWRQRYAADRYTCMSAAKTTLYGGHNDPQDVLLEGLAHAVMLQQVGYELFVPPVHMPDQKLTPFLEGYADVLQRLADGEYQR